MLQILRGPQMIRVLCLGHVHVWVQLPELGYLLAMEPERMRESKAGSSKSWYFQEKVLLHAHSFLDASPLWQYRHSHSATHTHTPLPFAVTFMTHPLLIPSEICLIHIDMLSTVNWPLAM